MRVSREFVENFNLVTRHYALPPEEIEGAKAAARRDVDAAATCFAALAHRIRERKDGGSVA